MYKLRTIDVWDTVLRRDCHPECVKLATARHLLFIGKAPLKSTFHDQWTLYDARVKTERLLSEAARSAGHDDEYEITDVLRRWLETVYEGVFYPELVHDLVEYELQVEIARSFPDHGIDDFLKAYPAQRTVFLSDFYMNGVMLTRLLKIKGLQYLIPDGISSCDARLNKRSGRLFQHVHAMYGLSPEEHLHVGDNPWSDVEAAKRAGVTAVHYLPPEAHSGRLDRERLFLSRDTLFKHVRATCHAESAKADAGKMRDRTAFNLGVEASPLFIGYALWIAEQALTHKLDRICFQTREGEFFQQVFSALFPQSQYFGHRLPDTNLLLVSRLSTFVASLREATIGEVSRAWTVLSSQRVSGLFTTLGLDIEDFFEILDSLGLDASDTIENPSHNPALQKLFSIPKFTQALELSISSQKSLLQGYLMQCGLRAETRIGIVDIGWRGTIQDNLALTLPHAHFHGMYLGLRNFVNDQQDNASKESYGPNENLGDELNELFEVFAALEMICSSPHGSVVGYRRDGDHVVCRREIIAEENTAYENFSADFQSGVLFAAAHWRPYLEAYVVTAAELRDAALKVWKTLRHAPGKQLTAVFMQTPQHDVFGFGELFERDRIPSVFTILLSPFHRRRRRSLIEFVRRVQWAAAIKNLHDISWFHRSSLHLTFRIANTIKLLRMKVKYRRNRSNNRDIEPG